MGSLFAPAAESTHSCGSDVHVASTAGNASTSDNINSKVLEHLESVFRSADKDSSGQLDMEEFVKAFKGRCYVRWYYHAHLCIRTK